MKEEISKGMNMKWSLYMSSYQQNLTTGSIRLKSDYMVVKISLTTGLGSYPEFSVGNFAPRFIIHCAQLTRSSILSSISVS